MRRGAYFLQQQWALTYYRDMRRGLDAPGPVASRCDLPGFQDRLHGRTGTTMPADGSWYDGWYEKLVCPRCNQWKRRCGCE